MSLVIRLREDGRLAGIFNISEIFRRAFQSAYLGYGGVAGLEGRGYMTEGMGLVLDYAFGELGLHRLEANIQPGNTASIALVRRCGFVSEGFSEKYLKIAATWPRPRALGDPRRASGSELRARRTTRLR